MTTIDRVISNVESWVAKLEGMQNRNTWGLAGSIDILAKYDVELAKDCAVSGLRALRTLTAQVEGSLIKMGVIDGQIIADDYPVVDCGRNGTVCNTTHPDREGRLV